MTKFKTALTVLTVFTLSGCASFDLGMLNPFSSDDETSNESKPEMNMPATQPEVMAPSDEQLQTMYQEWNDLKPELTRLLTLETDVAQLKQKIEQVQQAKPTTSQPSQTTMKKQAVASTTTPTGSFSVQIAAASTREAAEQAWISQKRRYSNFLNQYTPQFTKLVTRNKEFYRVLIGKFPTNSQAMGTCSSFQRMGGQCMIRKN